MTEDEDLLRDTMRMKSYDVTEAAAFGVPAGARRRTWSGPRLVVLGAGIAAATAAALTVTVVAVAANDREPGQEPAAAAELVGDVRTPPAGMQAVSSRGVEIYVPADWLINDVYCGQTAAATVQRGRPMGGDCYTPEPPTKTVSVIGPADMTTWYPSALTGDAAAPAPPTIDLEPVTVGGGAAERGQTVLPDGRIAGLLRFPHDDVAVAVRAVDATVVDSVLTSARLVDTDSAGCPTDRPDALGFVAASAMDPLASLERIGAASLCYYPLDDSRLGASVVIRGAALADLVDSVRALRFTPRADVSGCSDPRVVPEAEVLVALRHTDGTVRYVVTAQEGCAIVGFAPTHPGSANEPRALLSVLARTVHQGPGSFRDSCADAEPGCEATRLGANERHPLGPTGSSRH